MGPFRGGVLGGFWGVFETPSEERGVLLGLKISQILRKKGVFCDFYEFFTQTENRCLLSYVGSGGVYGNG